jgi:RimJ/RimL family protein N-acetyltransferase
MFTSGRVCSARSTSRLGTSRRRESASGFGRSISFQNGLLLEHDLAGPPGGMRIKVRIAGLSAVGVTVTAMRLEMMTAADVELRLRTETDPVMMAELGGPRPPEDIKRAHATSLAMAAEGRCWPLKVIPDGSAAAAGWVDVFESCHQGETIYEIGWMVLPEFQNRGIASQAVGTVLDKARAERKFGQIHAFPTVTNGPSNRLCEKHGFVNLGVCEFGFAGRTLRCRHWRIDLFCDPRR